MTEWIDLDLAPENEFLLFIVKGYYKEGVPFVPIVAKINSDFDTLTDPKGEIQDIELVSGRVFWMPLPEPPK